MNNFLSKWNTYQKERFPLAVYGLLIATLTLSAGAVVGNYEHTLAGFIMAIGIFMLLRIADEFKDYEDDCNFRSYRAVPRGLISLNELFKLGIFIIFIELSLAFLTGTLLLLLLIGVYWFLMSKEFFVVTWLKAHPVVYLLSHMMIMPLIALLLVNIQSPELKEIPFAFLALAFFNGVVLEIGRKIRQPEEEEKGVETYSFLWNKEHALLVWLIVTTLSLISLIYLVPLVSLLFMLILLIYIFITAYNFNKTFNMKAKKIEQISGVWLLMSYLIIFLSELF